MNSPEMSLAKSTLDLAQKHVLQDETWPDYAVALVETVAKFKSNCGMVLADDAAGKIVVFFQVTLGRRILDGRMGWVLETTRKSFALQCVEYLAKEAGVLAKGENTVTASVLEDAAGVMMELMKPHCPLPLHASDEWNLNESDAKLFSTACADLADAIGHQLDVMDLPKGDGGAT